jgi:hypothetical protein
MRKEKFCGIKRTRRATMVGEPPCAAASKNNLPNLQEADRADGAERTSAKISPRMQSLRAAQAMNARLSIAHRFCSMGGFTEIDSVFDTAAQPIIKVRLPLGSPRLRSGPFPRLIHGAARHNTVAAPSFPYPTIIRRRTDVPFETRHPYECSQDGGKSCENHPKFLAQNQSFISRLVNPARTSDDKPT